MPAARYWRIVAIDTYAGADLELSALHLHGGAARLDAAATISSTFAPVAGTLATLQDDDLATTCRFAGDAVCSGGFAIIWDFGAGNTADVTDLRIAGPLRDAFLARGTLQYSTAGSLWQWQTDVATDWTGAAAYHDAASAGGDPYYNSVSLLMHMDGADGSTIFTDSSPLPKGITAYGNAKVSTAQSKWGGSSGYFDGDGDYLFLPSSAAFGFGTADYTVECWIKTLDNDGVIFDNRPTAPGFTIFTNASGFGYYDTSGVNITSGTFITDGQWHHIAACRSAGTLRLFVDGAQKVSASSTHDLGTSNPVYIAIANGGSGAPLQCNIDDLRITKGVARYTANFTPPTALFAAIAVGHLRAPAPDCARIAAASAVPPHSALSAPPLLLARDMEFGGSGTVYGTVDRKGTPANIPLRRHVRLLSDASGMLVRETWSDATTGAFSFTGLDPAQRYTTLVYDHEHNFRAEAADNLTPEVPT